MLNRQRCQMRIRNQPRPSTQIAQKPAQHQIMFAACMGNPDLAASLNPASLCVPSSLGAKTDQGSIHEILMPAEGETYFADDIENLQRAEERRGRRPKDAETIEERKRMIAALREIWNNGTVDDLEAVMREYGLSPNSPEWSQTPPGLGATSAHGTGNAFKGRESGLPLLFTVALILLGENCAQLFHGPIA
jgi:hypothetical protein